MAKLINVEQSSYVSGIIDSYAKNKVGQYSKFLNLTPTFVTYYALNQVMSRTDTGTGTVASERGYNSPLRYNKIKGLPVYNIPTLTPDINYDETGMDVDLDLSDITLLPNTVKPTVPEFMIVDIPNSDVKALFRVNSFRYNTIQSNDFVNISLDLKEIGPDVEKSLEPLVVKTYYTIFDNIGTEDKCFIEEESINKVNQLATFINETIDLYQDMYWDETVGGYLIHSTENFSKVIYDVYLTKFINDTNLLPHPATTLTTLPYLDYVAPGSNTMYKRSIFEAILSKNKRKLIDNLYFYLAPPLNPFSLLKTCGYKALCVNLRMFNTNPTGAGIYPYYDPLLISAIIEGKGEYYSIPEESTEPEIPEDNPPENVEETTPDNPGDSEGSEEIADPTDTSTDEEVYSGTSLMSINYKAANDMLDSYDEYEEVISTHTPFGDLAESDIELIRSHNEAKIYVFNLILKYMINLNIEVDTDTMFKAIFNQSKFSFFYTPIIIYILKCEYDKYFSNVND